MMSRKGTTSVCLGCEPTPTSSTPVAYAQIPRGRGIRSVRPNMPVGQRERHAGLNELALAALTVGARTERSRDFKGLSADLVGSCNLCRSHARNQNLAGRNTQERFGLCDPHRCKSATLPTFKTSPPIKSKVSTSATTASAQCSGCVSDCILISYGLSSRHERFAPVGTVTPVARAQQVRYAW